MSKMKLKLPPFKKPSQLTRYQNLLEKSWRGFEDWLIGRFGFVRIWRSACGKRLTQFGHKIVHVSPPWLRKVGRIIWIPFRAVIIRIKLFLNRRPHRSFRLTRRRDYRRSLKLAGY